MKKLLFTVIFVLLAATHIYAQQEAPITWSVSARMNSETEGTLYIRANIENGWHLYSTSLPDGGPKPTSFVFSSTDGIKFEGSVKAKSKAIESLDSQFGITLSYYEETALFTRSFRIVPGTKDGEIQVKVTFMGCNDQTCLPPNTVNLKLSQSKFRLNKKK